MKAFEYYSAIINRYDMISHTDWRDVLNIAKDKYFQKDDVIIRQGEVAKVCGLVVNGSFKNVSYHNESEERILKFNFKTDFLSSCKSYNEGTPSSFAIVAMEPSHVLEINNDDLVKLCYASPPILGLGLILSQQTMQAYEEHLTLLSLPSPDLRYQYLLEKHGQLINKVSVTDLAKFMYISRESVSRARRSLKELSC